MGCCAIQPLADIAFSARPAQELVLRSSRRTVHGTVGEAQVEQRARKINVRCVVCPATRHRIATPKLHLPDCVIRFFLDGRNVFTCLVIGE